jgi:uncharacterized protein involved in response to NO
MIPIRIIPDPETPPCGFAVLRAAPHRALFLLGTAQALAAIAWWLQALAARSRGGLAPAAMPEAAIHAWLMLLGLFPFFVIGFLMTALPTWVNSEKPGPRAYLGCAGLLALGTLLAYAGAPMIVAAGLALHAAGLSLSLFHLGRVARGGRLVDKRHAWLAWSALLIGMLSDLAYLAGVLGAAPFLFEWGATLAIWGFLTPLYLTVCHRMIPFFTSRVVANYVVIQPVVPLLGMVAASLAHGLLELAGLYAWTWIADLPLAAIALWFTTRWGLLPGLGERLLAMLHIGFLWAGAAFALHALDSLLILSGQGAALGLAPTHALGIGFFGTMLLAMATRVTLGHSGRPLKADATAWALFWLMQCAALARMAPDLVPSLAPASSSLAAAWLWLGVMAVWASRHAPLLWRPRVDGRPG